MGQICCSYEIWLSENVGLITWLVDGQMQRDDQFSSVTTIDIQIGQQKVTIIEPMLVILKITK